jgi:hypothetical protein
MELGPLRNTLVGGAAMQMTAACRKKVAIAVELVANPALLLLAVPTIFLPKTTHPPMNWHLTLWTIIFSPVSNTATIQT